MTHSQVLRAISIQLTARSGFERGLIVVPTWAIPFFREGYKGEFTLHAPGKTAVVYLNSAKRGTRVGDAVGLYLWGKGEHQENVFRAIFAADRSWKLNAWANFERLPDGSVRVTLSAAPKYYHQTNGPTATAIQPVPPIQYRPPGTVIIRRRKTSSSTRAASAKAREAA